MKGFIRWLTGPDVLPLVARLALVALTAFVAAPEPAMALGSALEAVRSGNRL